MEPHDASHKELAGYVKSASFTISGQEFICIDSPVKKFTFTPSMSIFVECDSEAEITSVFKRLSETGEVLMSLYNYRFSENLGCVKDIFGVSWQLNYS